MKVQLTEESIDVAGLGGPFDRRVTQAPLDHLTPQAVGIFANGRARHESVLVHSIGFDFFSNVLVKTGEPFVRHMFYAHGNSCFYSKLILRKPATNGVVLARPRASREHRFSKDLWES